MTEKDIYADVNIRSRIENGKAYLEFDLFRSKETEAERNICGCGDNSGDLQESKYVIYMLDSMQKEVFRCICPLSEEPVKGILLHPHLWSGTEDPYLYTVRVFRVLNESDSREARYVEVCRTYLPLRKLEEIPGKGWFLNDRPFEIRAVRCREEDFAKGSYREFTDEKCCDGGTLQDRRDSEQGSIRKTLEILLSLGTNTICISEDTKDDFLKSLEKECNRQGFVMWRVGEKNDVAPKLSELFKKNSPFYSDTFYCYKALWSRQSFVHISESSIRWCPGNRLTLTVYSNQKKVALYVDGILFEFRTGGGEYLFEEIPMEQYPVMINVTAGECSSAVTVYGV